MKKQSTLMQLCMMLLMAMLTTTVRAEVVPLTENYSAESTTEGWTSSVQGDNPRFTPIIYNEAELLPGRGLDNNYFLSVNQSERNNNGCVVTGTILSGKAAAGDDFTLEFDMKLCNSNNNRSSQSPVSLQIKDANNEKDIFSLSAPEKYVSTWNVNGTDLQVTLPETGGMGIASLTWCHYVIARSGNLTYLTITNNATGETVLERTLIEGSSETGGLGNIVFTTKRYYANFAIDNIVVRALEESDVPSGEMSSYTIKYRNEGGYEIKPDVVTPFIVGNEATATAEQMAPIYYNDKKYLYKEGNNTITLVADASQNVITLVYREALQCNYTVKAIYGDKEKVLVEGKGIEGDAVTYNYPKYMLDGTTLYLKNQSATNPYFGKTITLSEENTIETVEYTDGAASDVVFYKEAEQMEGFTSLTTTNADIRCSDGKGGVIDGDEPVVLTTLPAGKYVIYGQVWGTAGYTATITADNATVWEIASPGWLEDATSELTLTKETTLYIKDSGDDEMRHKMLDLIYIQEAKQHYIAEYDRDASSLTFKKGILPLGSTTVWDAENTGSEPGWLSRIPYVTNVLFEESFADARPTSCALWFKGASKLTTITGLEYLNTSEVTSMSEMFRNCQQLTSLDLSTFYTKNVTDMYYMFYNDYRLTSLNVSSFNTAKVENMGLMFGYCSQLTSLDVSSFNTDAAVTVSGMFYYCSALKTIYSENSWSLPSLQDGGGNRMFYGCQNLVGGSGTVYDEEHTGAEYARIDGDMLGYFTKITWTKNELTLLDDDSNQSDGNKNANIISAASGDNKQYEVTLSGRTLYKDGSWNTLCLPFEVDLTATDCPLYGATARTVTEASITGSTLNLTFGDAVNTLEAGTPYIIKWDGDGTSNIENPVFEGVTIEATKNDYDTNAEGVTTDERVRFVGTYKSTAFDAENKSILLMGSENTLFYPTTGAGIGSFRAYFKIGGDDSALLARRLTAFSIDFGEDDNATGIINVSTEARNNADDWYSLDGRKLVGKPTQNGIYINNGKKITVK